MDDEVERTLCQLPHVFVFKVPTRTSADGYRASDWPKDPSWSGKLKIVAKGRKAAIFLLDDKNAIFAVCQASEEGAVERTLDSGRYFVLRITNPQGRHAYIGIAFNERNDAFDFNVALNEFRNEIEREDKASKFFDSNPNNPPLDLSLKSGEKIKIKINKKHKDGDDEEPTKHETKSTGGGFSLPAPKAGTAAGDPFGADPFGSDPFGRNDPFVTHSDPFASASGFSSDPFGSSDPFAKPAAGSKPAASNQSNNSVNLLDF